MKISVVIPVYNCEKWLDECIRSVLIHDRVAEVILVDDGSTDSSFKIAKQLASVEDRIKLLTHTNHRNQGRSISRNLAYRFAQSEWIAFLDADDYYLPNRFNDFRIIENVDGWYGGIETCYESADLSEIFNERTTEIKNDLEPESLLDYLIQNTDERFSLNAFTIKKSCLEAIDGFDPNLETGEDTDLIWRLSDRFKFQKIGQNEPIAVRRVHGQNTVFKAESQYQKFLFYSKWKNEIIKTHASVKSKRKIIRSYLYYHPLVINQKHSFLKLLIKGVLLLRHYAGVLLK